MCLSHVTAANLLPKQIVLTTLHSRGVHGDITSLVYSVCRPLAVDNMKQLLYP